MDIPDDNILRRLDGIQTALWRIEQAVHRRTAYLGDHQALTRLLSGHKIYVDTRDVGICSHLMLDGCWEPWVAAALMPCVKPGMRVVDVGANFGYYTLLMASAVGPSGHVFSVEANPHILSFLRRSVAVNGLGGWTTILGKAAYDREATLSFAYDVEFSGGGHLSDSPAPSLSLAEVAAIPLDTVIEPPVQVIKIDVEGAEQAALRGMERLIDRSGPLVIVMEFCRPSVADPSGFLDGMRGRGFTMRTLEPAGASDCLETAALLETVGERLTYIFFHRA